MSAAGRRERIERSLQARAADAETLRLPWQNDFVIFPVVNIPLDATVLNPRSHRIRAQLESHPRSAVIQADAFAEESQDVIRQILRELDPDNFAELLDSLRSSGQRDPGIVTHEGLLVNANRRATALYDVGEEYIRVAVLPPDAGGLELDQLELRLQIQRDFKDPYTFTNELMFVYDLTMLYGYDDARVARELGWSSNADPGQTDRGVRQVQQYRRMLATIRETQERAGGPGALPLTFFDDKRQSLSEMDDAVQRLEDSSADASALRDARLLGMLAGQGYQPLRSIDERFADYLNPHLEERPVLSGAVAAARSAEVHPAEDLPGLDIFSDPHLIEDSEINVTALLEAAMDALQTGEITIPLSDDLDAPSTITYDDFRDELSEAVGAAAEDAAEDRRFANELEAPAKHIRAAVDSLRKAGTRLDRVVERPELNRRRLKQLAEEMLERAEVLQARIHELPD
jgi:hypothetical protein